jgi:hypothetical protein
MTQLKDSLKEKSTGENTPSKEGQAKKTFLIILVVLVLVNLLVAAGVVFYIMNRSEEETSEESTEELGEEEWKTYTNEIYDFEFKYPSDWELIEENCLSEIECSVTVMKDNYVWQVIVNPIYTGGGVGFILDTILPPSEVVEEKLSIADFDTRMTTWYISQSDFGEYYTSDGEYNFHDDAWAGSLSYSKDEGGESYTTPGFGEREDTYYAIRYTYDSQFENLSDLPHKGDEKLLEMLDTMDQITNSFEINDDVSAVSEQDSYEGWGSYSNEEYVYKLRYPGDWVIDSSSAKCTLEDMQEAIANEQYEATCANEPSLTISNGEYKFQLNIWLLGRGGVVCMFDDYEGVEPSLSVGPAYREMGEPYDLGDVNGVNYRRNSEFQNNENGNYRVCNGNYNGYSEDFGEIVYFTPEIVNDTQLAILDKIFQSLEKI